MRNDPAALVDLDRYPIHDLDHPDTIALAAECRAGLESTGVAIVPDFVFPATVETIVAEAAHLAAAGHHQDLRATPYLEIPADHWPAGHPRRAESRSALTAIPYDDLGPASALRTLYEWDALLHFIARALGTGSLFRYHDPLGAVNVAVMEAGDELAWHFDQTDFVVSIALQPSTGGGDFECVPMLRTETDERYDDVAAALTGNRADRTTTVPMMPGTLMFFAGRHSLHRVTRVEGTAARLVALLGYDTKPGTCSSEILRLVRYGRSAARE